ncbi:hypothetical protein [Kitasatospora nipponensis]|uniref:hypothetical protein n=1 Tax=Kitasatospora nipponensis TaxID=258049 RepID=UPI0031E17D74
MLTSLLLIAAVVAGVVLWNRHQAVETAEGCEVTPVGGKPVTMDLEQGSNAATIAAVTIARGLPERALTIALATGLQESKLHNLGGGDRDSVGLFQQRPSQGWGTAQQIQDPVYATNKFLDALVKVNGYARLPLTEAAQDVQKSGYPGAYAKHELRASQLASALTGHTPASFSCTVHQLATPAAADATTGAGTGTSGPSPAAAASPAGGAAGAAQQVTDRVRREFGRAVTTTAATGGSTDAKAAGTGALALVPDPSAGTESGADAQRQSGWAVAQWAVAHAQELGIGAVFYDGKSWRVEHSADGWKPQADATATDRVLVTLGMPAAKH